MTKHAGAMAEAAAPTHWAERAFVTVKEASRICGLSAASIYRAAKDNKIALQKLGGRVVVTPAELNRFIGNATPWTPAPEKAHNTVAARAARMSTPTSPISRCARNATKSEAETISIMLLPPRPRPPPKSRTRKPTNP